MSSGNMVAGRNEFRGQRGSRSMSYPVYIDNMRLNIISALLLLRNLLLAAFNAAKVSCYVTCSHAPVCSEFPNIDS